MSSVRLWDTELNEARGKNIGSTFLKSCKCWKTFQAENDITEVLTPVVDIEMNEDIFKAHIRK